MAPRKKQDILSFAKNAIVGTKPFNTSCSHKVGTKNTIYSILDQSGKEIPNLFLTKTAKDNTAGLLCKISKDDLPASCNTYKVMQEFMGTVGTGENTDKIIQLSSNNFIQQARDLILNIPKEDFESLRLKTPINLGSSPEQDNTTTTEETTTEARTEETTTTEETTIESSTVTTTPKNTATEITFENLTTEDISTTASNFATKVAAALTTLSTTIMPILTGFASNVTKDITTTTDPLGITGNSTAALSQDNNQFSLQNTTPGTHDGNGPDGAAIAIYTALGLGGAAVAGALITMCAKNTCGIKDKFVEFFGSLGNIGGVCNGYQHVSKNDGDTEMTGGTPPESTNYSV